MFFRTQISCSALFSALVFCFAAALSAAQTPTNQVGEAPDASAPLIRTQTRLVVLDVLVRDSHGNPVKGLTLNDFELREDGAKRVLKTAEEHGITAPAAKSNTVLALSNSPGQTSVFTNKPPNGDVWNVLLVDALNPSFELQGFARKQLEKFVQQLPPEQPVALVIMGSPSRLVVPFSAGAAGIQKFFSEKKSSASSTVLLDDVVNLADISSSNGGQPNGGARRLGPAFDLQMGDNARTTEEKHEQSERQLLNTLAALAEWLSHYPGRKNVYWLSDGFPIIAADTDRSLTHIPPGRRAGLFGKEQQQMDKLLQNARIAVSPIDLSGVRLHNSFSGERNEYSGYLLDATNHKQ